MEISLDLLAKVFDIATSSLDFGSGFLDDEQVEALREVAVMIDVDPLVGTPPNYVCKYTGVHEPELVSHRTLSDGHVWCLRCHAWVKLEAVAP